MTALTIWAALQGLATIIGAVVIAAVLFGICLSTLEVALHYLAKLVPEGPPHIEDADLGANVHHIHAAKSAASTEGKTA